MAAMSHWTRKTRQSMVVYKYTVAIKSGGRVFQSFFVVLGVVVIGIFLWDIRRRALKHTHAVQRAKEEISAKTHMTATISTFADGKANEVILGASEDCSLFFYYIIVNGVTMRQYILARSEEHTSELQSHSETSDAVFCLKKKKEHSPYLLATILPP